MFENPSAYVGQALSLAGDELTIPQLLAAFRNVFGYDMPAADKATGDAVKAKVEDLGSMFRVSPHLPLSRCLLAGGSLTHRLPISRVAKQLFDQHGYKADVGALRKQTPKLKTWEDFLREEVKPLVPNPAI